MALRLQQGDPSPPRLIVSFNLSSIDALDVIPAILHQYTTRLKLDSSLLQVRMRSCAVPRARTGSAARGGAGRSPTAGASLHVCSRTQILDFVDEDVLQEAAQYLQANQSERTRKAGRARAGRGCRPSRGSASTHRCFSPWPADLQLLTRDFAMRYYPDGVDSNTTGLPDLAALLGPDATSLLARGNLSDLASTVSDVLSQARVGTSHVPAGQGKQRHLSALEGEACARSPVCAAPQVGGGRRLRGAAPQERHGAAAVEGAARRLRQQQDAAAVQVDDPLIVNGSQWHHVRIRTPVAWSTSEGAPPWPEQGAPRRSLQASLRPQRGTGRARLKGHAAPAVRLQAPRPSLWP